MDLYDLLHGHQLSLMIASVARSTVDGYRWLNSDSVMADGIEITSTRFGSTFRALRSVTLSKLPIELESTSL